MELIERKGMLLQAGDGRRRPEEDDYKMLVVGGTMKITSAKRYIHQLKCNGGVVPRGYEENFTSVEVWRRVRAIVGWSGRRVQVLDVRIKSSGKEI